MLHGWLIWLLSAFFMCYKYAIEVSPSIMTKELMSQFSLTGTEMGNLAACYFYAYVLMQIPAGLMVDRFGPRRVTTIAILFCAGGTYLLASASSFPIACLGRFIAGVGASFAAINCLKLIANWFPPHRFAFMAGLMMTVGMLGAVGGQGPLKSLVDAVDWRNALLFLAIGGVGLSVLFFFIVRDKAVRHAPVDLMPHRQGVIKNLIHILKNPQAWYLSFYSGFAFAPVSAFGGLWGVPFLSQSFKLSHAEAAVGSSLIFLGFALGAPLFGWYSDRIKKRLPVMFIGTLLAVFSLSVVLYVPHLSQNIVFALLFFFGFTISAFLLCFTMIKEINFATLAATSVGFMNAFDALFGAFSDPLTGKVLDLLWTGEMQEGARVFSLEAYQYALLVLVVYFVLALFFLRLIKETHCKQVYPSALP